MFISIWPFIIAIIGVLVYALATNPKVVEIGKWVFIIGFFWTVSTLVGNTLRIG